MPVLLRTFFVLTLTLPLAAQDRSNWWPPRVLYMEREDVLPGKLAEHTQLSEHYSEALTHARVSNSRVGLITAAGLDRERVFLSGYESMEALERARDDWGGGPLRTALFQLRARISDVLENRRILLGAYRPDLSHQPSAEAAAALSFADARFMYLNQHLVPFASRSQYEETNRSIINVLKNASSPRRWYVFEIFAGAPTGTMLRIETYRSLKEMDQATEAFAALSAADRATIGRPQGNFTDSLTPTVSMHVVNPRISAPR